VLGVACCAWSIYQRGWATKHLQAVQGPFEVAIGGVEEVQVERERLSILALALAQHPVQLAKDLLKKKPKNPSSSLESLGGM
jgi:hypothetical protein